MTRAGFESAASIHTAALVVAFALVTFLHVVVGELAPKAIALQRPGEVAVLFAQPLLVFGRVFRWILLAMNGAGIIHDFELALSGATSEDVDEALGPGRFGMAEETGRQLNGAISDGVASGLGLGQSVVAHLHRVQPPHPHVSVLAAAGRLEIPVTVHVGIGTDIIHMHPDASGAAIGEGSLRDFRYFVSNVARLEHGVYLNCGSAVLLPEVFLKAVALARNTGRSLQGLTTVNIDFIRHYRPATNVVSRPVAGIGNGYSLIGHHEILIPLLAAALIER